MTSSFNRRRYDSSLERQARLAAAFAVASANRSRPRSMSLDQQYLSRRSEWIFFIPNNEVT